MPVLFINNSCSTDRDHSQMWMEPLQGLHKAFYSNSIVEPRKRVNLHSQRSQDLQAPHPGKVGALVGRVGKNAPCPILRSSLRTTSAWEEAAMPATSIFHVYNSASVIMFVLPFKPLNLAMGNHLSLCFGPLKLCI